MNTNTNKRTNNMQYRENKRLASDTNKNTQMTGNTDKTKRVFTTNTNTTQLIRNAEKTEKIDE